MIKDLQTVFHSITKSLEVFYVIKGIKPCARILIFEDKLEETKEFLKNQNLFFEVSKFKVLKQNIQSEFYSDKSIKINKDDKRKGHLFLYISKDKNITIDAKNAEENNDHMGLGLLLGYPKCCTEFFSKHFSENKTDLTLKTLENSKGFEFSFLNNICTRHFDVSLLSHFPHSFECTPSLEMAKNNLELINEDSKEIADFFEKMLKCLVIYTGKEGIILARNFSRNENSISYSSVISTSNSKLYYLVSSKEKLQIENKNKFTVNEITIEGIDYGIIIFNQTE